MIQEINESNDDILNVNDYDDFAKNKQKIYKKDSHNLVNFINRIFGGVFIEDYVKALVDNTLNTLTL